MSSIFSYYQKSYKNPYIFGDLLCSVLYMENKSYSNQQ